MDQAGVGPGWIRPAFDATMQGVRRSRVVGWGMGVALVTSAPWVLGWALYRSESGALLHWDKPALTIALAEPPESLDRGEVVAALDWAMAQWQGLDCDGPTLTRTIAGETRLDPADEVNAVVWVEDPVQWRERFSATELARTILIYRVQSGRLVDTDIAVNVGGFDFATDEECQADRYDMRMMFTHELGHVFGLDHSVVDGATMEAKAEPGDCSGRTLEADDRAGYCANYDRPAPIEPGPEPGAEVVAEIVAEPAVEASPEAVVERAEGGGGGRKDGCAGGAGPGWGLFAVMSAALGRLRALRRCGRRAS